MMGIYLVVEFPAETEISFPIEIKTMERVVEYMLKVQKSLSYRLLRITQEVSKKMHKSKILCSD